MNNYFVALPVRLSARQFEKALEHFNGERSNLSPTLYGYIEKGKAHVHVEVMTEDDGIITNDDQVAVKDLLGDRVKQVLSVEIDYGIQSYALAKEVAFHFASSFGGIFDEGIDPVEALKRASYPTND